MGATHRHLPTEDLARIADRIRRVTLNMGHRAKASHVGSALSMVDLLACLYFGWLRVDAAHPQTPDRDRFILSKGHGALSLYAALAEAGFFSQEILDTYVADGSIVGGHPSAALPGIEFSTGSLGHGLPCGNGLALAAKLDGKSYRTVVLISDGECDEGSTWEAALAAAHWKLGGLVCIVDYNKIQSFGRTSEIMELEPFADKWRAFGWHVQEIDGHAHAAIIDALRATESAGDCPHVIIAHTVKGKGYPALENTVDCHYRPPNDAQLQEALRLLA